MESLATFGWTGRGGIPLTALRMGTIACKPFTEQPYGHCMQIRIDAVSNLNKNMVHIFSHAACAAVARPLLLSSSDSHRYDMTVVTSHAIFGGAICYAHAPPAQQRMRTIAIEAD